MSHPRTSASHTVQHIICRYHGRQILVTQAAQRRAYLERFERTLARTDWTPLAYALMGNHNHAAWWAERAPLHRFYQPLNKSYAHWMNAQSGRIGSLFAGRPRNITFDPLRTAYLIAYIHNNPVRAGAAADPADSDWTSHRAFIGECRAPGWLDVKRALDLCGFEASSAGRLAFHEFVLARSGDVRDPEMSGSTLTRARRQVRADAGSAIELDQKVDDFGSTYGVLVRPETTLRRRWRGSPSVVVGLISRATGVSPNELCGRTRRRPFVEARRLALLVWAGHLECPMVEMSAVLGLSAGASSQLLANDARLAPLQELARQLAAQIRTRGRPPRGGMVGENRVRMWWK